jgi:pyruvate kinase
VTIKGALEVLMKKGLVKQGDPIVILSDALYDEMNVEAILLREA